MGAAKAGVRDPGSTYDFVISRSTDDDRYAIWRFELEADQLLTKVSKRADLTFDHTHQLAPVGNYLLDWGPVALPDSAPCYPYRLFSFDPLADDPLGKTALLDPRTGKPALTGTWPKRKFVGALADFGNPDGAKKAFQDDPNLHLVPLGNFVLNWIPAEGRGTYALWVFDPDPWTATGASTDPLPFEQTPQGAFQTIRAGHTLLPLGNFVLEWVPVTKTYSVWSFDPEPNVPLVTPAAQHGTWDDIDETHELVPVGDDVVLDWVPGDRSYRVWAFDPYQANPLTELLGSGQLPGELTPATTLLAVQPQLPVDPVAAAQPATIDFMRTKVKHVVYYMLENRSFDHVLGWLHAHDEKGLNFIGSDRPFDGAGVKHYNVDTNGKKVHQSLYHHGTLSDDIDLDFFTTDPYHDNADVLEQLFFGDPDGYRNGSKPNMGGFVVNNESAEVMVTYGPDQLPVINGLAREFAVSDEWFCSTPSATDPNRAFGLTGSSLLQLNNFQNGSTYEYWPMSSHRPSIFKVLWNNGIEDWRIYNSIEWMTFVHTYHLFLQGHIPKVDADTAQFIAPFTQFLADAKAGNLPAFSFLEPVWIPTPGQASATSSYHPGEDLIPGEQQLNDVFDAISSGPGWEETMLVVTFDEHGGIYDHAAPPRAVNPWPNDEIDGFRFDILGPRVPAIIVSPHIQRKTVFRSSGPVAYDLTSVLATVLEWFGIPKARWGLGERVRHAPTFEGLLQLAEARTDTPKFSLPYDKNYPRAGPPTGAGRPLHGLDHLMVPRAVWALTGGTLTAPESNALAEKIMDGADAASVHAALKHLAATHG